MAQLTLFTQDDNQGDNEKVKARHVIFDTWKKWGFEVRTIEHGDDYLYSIIDWTSGMVGHPSKAWGMMKPRIVNSIYFSFSTIQYEGKGKPTDFTDEYGVYLITQNMRSTSNSPAIDEIKSYLAKTGVFANKLISAEPIEAQHYFEKEISKKTKSLGKSKEWQDERLDGMVARDILTQAIQDYIVNPNLAYGTLTNTEYMGLFHRTAKQLTAQNGGLKPRDGMHLSALSILRTAEISIASKISQGDLITLDEAIAIAREVCKIIEPMINNLSAYLGVDIATDKKLLKS